MNPFSIVGFWKFKSNRVRLENGDWLDEKLSGGTMAFSDQGEVILLVRSEQGPWGYAGKYTVNQQVISIKVQASTADGLDGTTIERSVHLIDANELIFSGKEAHTERSFETHFIRA
jgi:hypothetical protein